MDYKTMRLYNEIKAEMLNVIDAEDNAAAWKKEAAIRMKDVNALIVAAQKVNKEITIDRKALIQQIRDEITAETEPMEPADPDAYLYREAAANPADVVSANRPTGAAPDGDDGIPAAE